MTSIQSVSVELPDELYERIREVAERHERSVESVLRESLEVMFGTPEPEPDKLLTQSEAYRDDQLWALVYRRMAWPQSERLHELIMRGRQEQLTPAEQTELDTLLDLVDRYTLARSQALRLLYERGHDVDHYLATGP